MILGVHHYIELLSLIIAIIRYRELKGSFVVYFIPFLLTVFLLELVCNYLYTSYNVSSKNIYTVLNPVIHCFYAYTFYKFFTQKSRKIILLIGIVGFCLLCAADYMLTKTFNNYLIAIGGIMQVVFACLYFYQYLQNDNNIKSAASTSGLWIASGVLIFYSGISICFSLYHYIIEYDLKFLGLPLYQIIPRYLSVILYSSLSIAFLVWKTPKEKISL